MVAWLIACALVALTVALAALVIQLRARDPDGARRRPALLRALAPAEVRLVTIGQGAANDAPVRASGLYAVKLLTTREERVQLALLFGLGPTAAESAEALDLELVPSMLPSRRQPATVDGDELLHRPGNLHAALVACCAEAFRRAEVAYTWQDAEALAQELVSHQIQRATK